MRRAYHDDDGPTGGAAAWCLLAASATLAVIGYLTLAPDIKAFLSDAGGLNACNERGLTGAECSEFARGM